MVLPVKKRERGLNPLSQLHEEMDELFGNFFEDWPMSLSGRNRWPAVDVAENKDEFIVKAEVPGCRAEDIDISVHDSRLTISGEKKQEKEEQEKGYYHFERSYGTFRRQLNLGSEVDPDKIEATCKDGVLSIRLPKTEKTKAVKVKIKTG